MVQTIKKPKPVEIEKMELEAGGLKTNESSSITKQHDFVRTHFNRTTSCDYCGKKVYKILFD